MTCFVTWSKMSLNRNVQQRLSFSAVPLQEHHGQEGNDQCDVENQENSVDLFRHPGPVSRLLLLLVVEELSYGFLHHPQLFWQPLHGDELLQLFARTVLKTWVWAISSQTKEQFFTLSEGLRFNSDLFGNMQHLRGSLTSRHSVDKTSLSPLMTLWKGFIKKLIVKKLNKLEKQELL